MTPRHLLTLADLGADRMRALIEQARRVKGHPSRYVRALYEKTLLMIFEAPSLRTRLSFETAMTQLHGHAINYYTVHSPWGVGKESIEDFARTVSRYCDGVTARLYSHEQLRGLATAAEVPVINAMTDLGHPCQILGDLMTIAERFGSLAGVRIAYVGDARNNVTYSWMRAAALLGLELAIACPAADAYRPDPAILAEVDALHTRPDGHIDVDDDPAAVVAGARVVYTDSWMSYRIPAEEKERRMRDLEAYRVVPLLIEQAAPDALFMHCLPALRTMEVAAEVIDGPQSVVFDQAENRLHVEKAILLDALGSDVPV